MIAFDCAKCAANFLSDAKMVEVLERIEEDNSAELTKAEKAKVKEYLNAVSIAASSVAAEEISLRNKKEVVSSDECKVSYTDLSDRLYEVLAVVDKTLGASVDFYALPFDLFVPKPNRAYVVEFKYLPRKVETLFDEIELSPLILPEILARLMVSDILLAKNSYDEAAVWRDEYRRALGASLARKRKARMPYRKF